MHLGCITAAPTLHLTPFFKTNPTKLDSSPTILIDPHKLDNLFLKNSTRNPTQSPKPQTHILMQSPFSIDLTYPHQNTTTMRGNQFFPVNLSMPSSPSFFISQLHYNSPSMTMTHGTEPSNSRSSWFVSLVAKFLPCARNFISMPDPHIIVVS